MEPPSSFDAEAVRREKVKAWRAIPSIPMLNAVRGQYGPGVVKGQKVVGYRDEERVNPESGTETYAAIRLEIENWRWAGVPFYLRAGKRMKRRATEISIQFKQPPLLIFNRMQSSGPCQEIQPNLLTIRIQPDEGIALRFGAKVPNTPNMSVCPVNMDFDYAAAFGNRARMAMSGCCSTRCWAIRPCLRIATAWKLHGRCIRRSSTLGRPRIRRCSRITSRAHGGRIAATVCWSEAGMPGGITWAGKASFVSPKFVA